MRPIHLIALYLLLISLIAVTLTVYDKYAAKKRPRHRTPERVLLLTGALGGAAAMYLTMLLIRHKTLHKKFMIGLPLMIAGQILVGGAAVVVFIMK